MAELTPDDVEDFTGGRLAADDPQVQRMLDAALAAARHDMGWHVSPEITEDVTLDVLGSTVVYLPTRKLVKLDSVRQYTEVIDPDSVSCSQVRDAQVRMRKRSGDRWISGYGSVQVSMVHGYSETEAADWRQAILMMVDEMSNIPLPASGKSDATLSRKKVDDVEYEWSDPYASAAQASLFSVSDVLAIYRLPVAEFV